MSLFEEVSGILEAAGIRHALIGALALSAYGINRATVQQLLTRPFREDLIREVESHLSEFPARCRDLWKKILQG